MPLWIMGISRNGGRNLGSVKRSFRYRKMMLLGYVPRRADFLKLETCPICTQTKPAEDYHPKEIMHMVKHLRRVRGEVLITMFPLIIPPCRV